MTRVALVSCVKKKRTTPTAAADLYVSPLFLGMRRYAERMADSWLILSAEHGALRPEQIVGPYERTLNSMSKPERVAWAQQVQKQLLATLPAGATIIVLAGARYRENVVPFLMQQGFKVEVPMAGLPLGMQLRWLKQRASDERSAG